MTTSDKAALLARFIEERRRIPFAWGSNDCCFFASDWVLLATGKDFAAEYRGKFSSALPALRYLKDHGGVEGFVERAGGRRLDPKLAQRGDIVARDVGSGIGLGVCIGSLAAFVAEDGLGFVDFAHGSCWRF